MKDDAFTAFHKTAWLRFEFQESKSATWDIRFFSSSGFQKYRAIHIYCLWYATMNADVYRGSQSVTFSDQVRLWCSQQACEEKYHRDCNVCTICAYLLKIVTKWLIVTKFLTKIFCWQGDAISMSFTSQSSSPCYTPCFQGSPNPLNTWGGGGRNLCSTSEQLGKIYYHLLFSSIYAWWITVHVLHVSFKNIAKSCQRYIFRFQPHPLFVRGKLFKWWQIHLIYIDRS